MIALTLACLAVPTPVDPLEEREVHWSQWRGPARDGSSIGPRWPSDLAPETLRVAWEVEELGPSYSGPVVDAERVYTTETRDESREVVSAFDRRTGELVWRTSWEGAMDVPFFARRNGSWIRSTPALANGRLYVAGMRDVLVCLDAETGDVHWTVDFLERLDAPLPPFGCVPSPLPAEEGDDVFMQAGTSLVRLDGRTGEIVWRSLGESADMMTGGAFSSPTFGTLLGRRQLVVQSRTRLAGVDPADGAELWSTPVEAYRNMNILTPTIVGDAVFTSTYGGRSQLFELERADGDYEVHEAWNNRAQGYMTSPVVVDGHAYLFLRSNRFACVDLESGEDEWISPPTGDTYWSLAVQGDRILALSDTGILRLVAANPDEYQVLAEREVTFQETWAHVAPSENQVFVRALGSLIALEWAVDAEEL